MKKHYSLCLLLITFLIGCADLDHRNSPYYQGGGYNSGYNGGYQNQAPYYGNGSSYDRDNYRDQRERERLNHERDRLEDERRRLEYERRQDNIIKPPVYVPQQPRYEQPRYEQPRVERCPSGFSPSENKCSQDDRRRGCRDMRLPGGLGCVSR